MIFSTLNTTLPHDLIKNRSVVLIKNTFSSNEVLYLACNEESAFFACEEHKKYIFLSKSNRSTKDILSKSLS